MSNLKALLVTAFAAQTDVQVWFGGTLSVFVSPKTIQITGWSGDQQPAEMGPSYRREETFAIHLEIDCFSGDQDFFARQTEVMNVFDTISALIGNNPTLPSTAGGTDGAVRYAEVGTFNFSANATSNGQSLGTLHFDVHCSQRIQSLT